MEVKRRNAPRQKLPDFSFGFAPRESSSPQTPKKPADSGNSKNPPDFREGSETPSKPRESAPRESRSPFSIPRPRSFKRSDTQSDMHSDTQTDMHSDTHPDMHPDVHPDIHADLHSNLHQNSRSDMSHNMRANAHPDTHPDAHSRSWLPRSRLGQSPSSSSSSSAYRNPFYCYFERQRSFRTRSAALGRRGCRR